MSEDTAVKYLDVDSTYRNRNNYPNPYDFVVPYSFPNKGSTSLGFFDAVLDSSPYTGSPTLQPGELVTEGTFSMVPSTTTAISLDLQDSPIDNFYINATLQLGDQFRTIISYNGTTKLCVVSLPFLIAPPAGTVYYIRKAQTYFNSEVSIYRSDPIFGTTDQLNLLTAAPSPTKDFYSGSYIRFTNGSHVGETALITNYDPFQSIAVWNQEDSPGQNQILSNQPNQSIRIFSSTSGYIKQITLNLTSFGNRTLNILVREGSTLTGTLVGNESFVIPDTSSQTDYVCEFTSQLLLASGQFYTLTFQDVSGSFDQGYINIFGTIPTPTLVSFGWNVYPKISMDILQTPIVAWTQPDTENTSYISTVVENGYKFTPLSTGDINSLTISMISFETVSAGRTLNIKIRNGSGVSGSILFEEEFVISDTAQVATDTVITFSSLVSVSSSSTYTLTIIDVTPGGTSTGFVNTFGIASTIGYITYNTGVYPKLNLSYQIQDKIVPAVAVPFETQFQGKSVSLSGDGTTLAIGSPGGLGTSAAGTWIYILSGGSWVKETVSPLLGTGGVSADQGWSVALSTDGNTLAVGGKSDGGDIGAVWIFTRTGGVWSQQGSKIVGIGSVSASRMGYSVSLSADGNTLAFGGPGDSGGGTGIGATWVYTRSGGVWSYQTKMIGSASANFTNQGTSVSLSADGNTLAIGGPFSSGGGATWIFNRSGGFLWTQTIKLQGTGGTGGGTQQGTSVSLSGDGNTLVVGGPFDNFPPGIGAVWIFILSGTWIQQGSKLIGTGASDGQQQGSSCSLSFDGNTLAFGGSATNSNVGSMWIFNRVGSVWTQYQRFVGSGSIGASAQGFSCSLSDDGLILAIGGSGDDSQNGAAWVTQINIAVNQPSNSVIYSPISTVTPYGFQFDIPPPTTYTTSVLSSIILESSSFESVSEGRNINVQILDGAGLAGSVLYTGDFIISNTDQNSVILSTNAPDLVMGNTYTFVLQDTTSGGTTTGSFYVYGITPTVTYVTFGGVTTYPKTLINHSPIVNIFSQPLNPTIFQYMSTVSPQGFLFSPVFDGTITSLSLMITSFDTSGFRDVNIKLLSGAGLGGSVLFQTDVSIPNISERRDFLIPISSTVNVTTGNDYTISIQDISSGGTLSGNISIYGITPISPYDSYNISVYPRINIRVSTFIITISPPKLLTGFNNPPTFGFGAGPPDAIEFNSQAHENATTLFQNGVQAHNAQYYKIGLKYLVIPNQILNVGRGGKLDNYPYIYVQIYNDGNRGSLNVMNSDNPNAALAVFKVPIDRNLYDIPTSFFTLKTPNKDQVVKFRPDQNIRVTLTLPDGTIIQNQLVDNLSPLFPNPLLQVNVLFTLLPIDKYDYIPSGDFGGLYF